MLKKDLFQKPAVVHPLRTRFSIVVTFTLPSTGFMWLRAGRIRTPECLSTSTRGRQRGGKE